MTQQQARIRSANACYNRIGYMTHVIRTRLKRPFRAVELAYIKYLRRMARQNHRAHERSSH